MRRLGLGFLLLLLCKAASAYTECPPIMLSKIHSDADGNFFVATGGYLNGHLSPTAKPTMAIAIAAYTTGRPAVIRYGRDGVVCGSAAWNEQIISVAM